MSSRLDAALRQLVEAGVPLEDLNPEVLSRDFEDPRFGKRPWNLEPKPEPYMGDWLPAFADKIGSGISGTARWVDENVPSMGGPVDAEFLASFIEPLRGSDLGATGTHAGDVYPGAPKAASMVIGPAAAFVPKGYKAIKRLFGGADEVAFQPKLPGTARTEKKKPEPEKPQEKTIDKLIAKNTREEALEKQGKLPQSLDYELEVREISQARYDELIDDGWDYQEILDAHPTIPYSVRKEGREILGLESPVDSFLSRISRTPKVRKPQTELGEYYGKLADDSGYTEIVTRPSPVKGHGPTRDEKVQGFYDYLDWKATEEPGFYLYKDFKTGNLEESTDLHELFRDILDCSTGSIKEPNFYFKDWKKQIPTNLSNDPKLKRWPDQIPEKGKGRLQDQPDFPINHPAKTEFGKYWGNMADESGYTDLIANYNPTNSPLHTPEKAKEAFYQMLDMDPAKRFVNHDSKSNYDIHTIFREIEKFAQNPSDMSVINFKRYKRLPDLWQWGRN